MSHQARRRRRAVETAHTGQETPSFPPLNKGNGLVAGALVLALALEARLRAEFIVQVLQEDCGVHYNVERLREIDFSKPADLFIHGLVNNPNGGTCSSMPVLYAAIGRRLGYPVKLALAKEHIFCRWDEGQERFNFDGSANGGISYHDDEYYRQWPHPIGDAEMASGEFLKPLKPKEELATFLLQRAACLRDHGRIAESRACLNEALHLMPNSPTLQLALRSTAHPQRLMRRAFEHSEPYLPPEVRASLPPDPTPRIPMPGAAPMIKNQNPSVGITKQEISR